MLDWKKNVFQQISSKIPSTAVWIIPCGKTRSCLSYISNTIAVDDLATLGARASAAMVLNYVKNSLVLALDMLTLNILNCFKDYKRYIHILNDILDLD